MQRRTTARVVGLLFIIATVAGVLSVILLQPQGAADALASAYAHKNRITLGALMVLLMAAAIAMIPPMIFPVLKQHNEALALGYVVARTLEVVVILPAAVSPLLLLTVSSEYAEAGAADAPHFDLALTVLRAYEGWGLPVSTVFFCLSVTLLNFLLFRSRLVPRLISVWGLVAVTPYLADGILVMFGRVDTSSTEHTLLTLPLALNEMALALWLLTKGFKTAATPATEVAEAVGAR